MFQFNNSPNKECNYQPRHKSIAIDYSPTESNLIPFEILSTANYPLLKLRHRRKFQSQDQKQALACTWKRKFSNQIAFIGSTLPFNRTETKKTPLRHLKRNTFNYTPQPQKVNLTRISGHSSVGPRHRMKNSLSIGQKAHNDKLFRQNLETKVQGKIQMKNPFSQSLKQEPKLIKKKSKELSRTSNEFNPSKESSPLVELIHKFKFQNLKNSNLLSESENQGPQPLQIQLKRPEMFAPFYSQQQSKRETPFKKKMNKTMVKINYTASPFPLKIQKKLSALTPWEMDNKQLLSTNDIF